MLESAFIEVSPLLQSAAKISPHILFCALQFEFPSIFSCECVTPNALKCMGTICSKVGQYTWRCNASLSPHLLFMPFKQRSSQERAKNLRTCEMVGWPSLLTLQYGKEPKKGIDVIHKPLRGGFSLQNAHVLRIYSQYMGGSKWNPAKKWKLH